MPGNFAARHANHYTTEASAGVGRCIMERYMNDKKIESRQEQEAAELCKKINKRIKNKKGKTNKLKDTQVHGYECYKLNIYQAS